MDEHAAKRQKTLSGQPLPMTPISPTFKHDESAAVPELPPYDTVHVCAGGDAVIVVSGIANISKPIGLRVSTEALSISSPVLKQLLADARPVQSEDPSARPLKVLALPEDDGDAVYTLLNVLHLRNDILPARMDPFALVRFIAVALKYSCIPAASRATSPWFDHIFTRHPSPPLYKMVESALIVGDAIYFARFSSRWVLNEPRNSKTANFPGDIARRPLTQALLKRLQDGKESLRVDLDDLVDPLADALSSDYTHYVDQVPGDDPTPVDMGGDPNPVRCTVDKDGAVIYLGALRDQKIWPANQWPNTNLQAITDAVEKFRIPDFDSSENCHYCAHVEDEFAEAVESIKQTHKDRLWGLCLECYKSGGVNPGECRYEHSKPASTMAANQ